MADEGFNHRLAGLDDYQAVLDLDNNFMDGADYLMATYKSWCQFPDNYVLFVTENHGKVVMKFNV